MNRLNRRQFGTLLSSSAAIAASGSLCGPLRAQGTEKTVAPNDKLDVCIVGLNGRGAEHIRGFNKDPRTHIATIVDIDETVAAKRADQIQELQGHRPAIFRTIREALDQGKFDLLSCATPNHWHALCGIWAMQAGKDVYIEKPISHNIHEGRALVAAAKKYGRMFQTGTQCRSSSALHESVAFMEAGGIGEVNFARGLCYKRRKSIGALGDYQIPEGVDFDQWSGPATLTNPRLTREQFHYDWHWQRQYGNGDSGNQGPHQTDIARWGLGLDRHPHAVMSYAGRLGYPAERKDPHYVDAGDTANTQVSIYDYGDKCIVFETRGLDVSQSAGPQVDAMFGKGKGNKIGVIFHGSEGYLAQTGYGTCKVFDLELNETKVFVSTDFGDAHFANFIDACQSRDYGSLNADAQVGHLSAAVAHHGNTSYYLGQDNKASVAEIQSALSGIKSLDNNSETLAQTVAHLEASGVDLGATPLSLGPLLKFDPEAEHYLDNDQANAMLTREYRPGFEVPSAENV